LVFEDTIEVKVGATVRYTLTDQTLGNCGTVSGIMLSSIRCTGVILGFANLLAYFQFLSKRNY